MFEKVRKVVVPAAGLGTRFLPATKAVPKELLPIVDTPTLQLIVDEAVRAGFEDVILINGRGKSAIEDHFDIAYELEDTMRRRGKEQQADELSHAPGGRAGAPCGSRAWPWPPARRRGS